MILIIGIILITLMRSHRLSNFGSKSLELVQRPHVENLIGECISIFYIKD